MPEHNYFDELCAVAASGQISPEEWKALRDHLDSCAVCVEALSTYGMIGVGLIAGDGDAAERIPMGGIRARFLQKAEAAGLRLNSSYPQPVAGRSHRLASKFLVWGGIAASLLIAAGLIWLGVPHKLVARRSNPQPVASIGVQRGADVAKGSAADVTAAQIEILTAQRDSLLKQVHEANVRDRGLSARIAQLLAEASDQRTLLQDRDRSWAGLQAERDKTVEQLSRTEAALARARADRLAAEATLAARENDVEQLNARLQMEAASVERERVAAMAGTEGQSILAARNLHIIDVYDTDGRGARRKAFGRVFYVEGKELLFYAYDLSDPRHSNAHFYAWGAGSGDPHFVARLGILHNGGGESCWTLRFDDPGLLSKIDSIFVTAERDEVNQPKGKRILFAVLTGQPNHS